MRFCGWAAVVPFVTALATLAPAETPAEANPPPTELTGTAAIGRELYLARCSNCHSNKAGETLFAPTLRGVIGRKAGGMEGFPYSEKLQNLDFAWTPDSLRGWLSTQSLESPILRMRHLGVEDPGDVQALVEFLATLKD